MKAYLVSKLLHFCNIAVPRSLSMPYVKTKHYDLTFVLSGRLEYTVGEKTYLLSKNDAVFIPPGVERSRRGLDESVKYVSFNFCLADGVTLPFETFMKDCITSDIRKLVASFPYSHMLSQYYSEQRLMNLANCILLELLQTSSVLTKNEHVLCAVRFIDEHITERISLASLSEKLSLSREYLAYIFKKETGKRLTDFVNERKMMIAKELVSAHEMTLSDISQHLGYDNYNYFSRLFKRYFDISPKALRNNR